MLPMGWNQIRQSRMLNMQQNLPQHQPSGQSMPNHQPYDPFRQPMMQPQPQMFQPQMMGGFVLQDPQMVVGNPVKPPEPDGPPPPSPPAPLPKNDSIPPPPPDDGQWWITEMKNVPSNQHRQELERMVNEKWFQSMTTSQQIECWQHKLQLINKKKAGSAKTSEQSKPAIISAPTIHAPPRLAQPQPLQSPSQSGNIDEDIKKAREDELGVKQQVATFQRQYGEWKKQFDDWKDKHKSHPNKEQFAQYESQWMLWQKQMSDQKMEYDTKLKSIQDRLRSLERQKVPLQNENENFQEHGQRQMQFSGQQSSRFPIDSSHSSRFVHEPQNLTPCQDNRSLVGHCPPRDGGGLNLRQRFPRPQFGNNQGPGCNQRPRLFASGTTDLFRNRPPLDFHGQRPRFDRPNHGGPRFDQRWQQPGSLPSPRSAIGSRFRSPIPRLMEQEPNFGTNTPTEWNRNQTDWAKGEENSQGKELQPNFHSQDRGRGVRIRGVFSGGVLQDRFINPSRVGNPGNRMRFRGPRPFTPNCGPRGNSAGPRPWFGGQHSQNNGNIFANDDIPENNNFFTDEENGDQKEGLQSNKNQRKKEDKNADDAKSKEWNVSRDMVPLEFGVKKSGKHVNRLDTFTVHDIYKESEEELEEEIEPEENVEAGVMEEEKDEELMDDPEHDYSHYFTDDYNTFQQELKPSGRGTTIPNEPYRGIGRGNLLPPQAFRAGRMGEPSRGRGREGNFSRGQELEKSEERSTSSVLNTSTANSSAPSLSTEKLMEKVKELTNTDVKNLLSAVKSVTNSSQSKERMQSMSGMSENWNLDREKILPANRKEERVPEQTIKDRNNSEMLPGNKDLLGPANRLTEAELIAAGLDPVSLGLRDEDLLLQEYLLNPGLRNATFSDPALSNQLLSNPALDPLLQESFLERELLREEIRVMREREEARQREEAMREAELRRALTKPVVQAQKIVETIDYSHGLKDTEKNSGGLSREEVNKRMPHWHDERGQPPWGREPPTRDRPYRADIEEQFCDIEYQSANMDERMREREHGFFLPGKNEDFERGFIPPMDERRRWPPMQSREPYEPASSVVVTDDVIQNKDPLKKHWEILDRERESVERRRQSMERRRNSLERMQPSREREEERRDRERSMDRLRKMEMELREREKMLVERERRLRSPPIRRSRDDRNRKEWRPEGPARPRSVTPPHRRMQERPLKHMRGERRHHIRSRSRSWSRERSCSPNRRRDRDWHAERLRARSPPFRRDRSPAAPRNHSGGFRDRRRFTSPSGDPSKKRLSSGITPKVVKVKPVFVRVEDLLNDLARQHRPKRIVIVLRGLPGSGKSHIAKLIRDRESAKGVAPRLLGLDDYFMVENEKFEKDSDTGKIVKRKVHEYEYDSSMEPKYRESLLRAFKKTLENGFFNFVIVDSINDKVSHFSEFWTAAKKCVFEVYVAELTADVHTCEKRNIHKRTLAEIQEIANGWEETPQHMIRLDVRQLVQDSEIQEVEMGDVSNDEDSGDTNKEKASLEQLAGIPQSKWERMETNERLDKLDGITKKKLASSQQHMAEFLSVTDDYIERSSAPGKKRVRWADIQEKSAQRRLREVGFVVGNTDWSRLVDGDTHAEAALNRTKFI